MVERRALRLWLRLEIAYVLKGASRVQIPPSPPQGCKRRWQSRRRAAKKPWGHVRYLVPDVSVSVVDARDEVVAAEHLLRRAGEAHVEAGVAREQHLVAGCDPFRVRADGGHDAAAALRL